MTVEEFKEPDHGSLEGALLALWFDRQDDWERAYSTAQDLENRDGAWVHAYLHRKEGDPMNAAYWYRRAAKPVATGELATEWEVIAQELLGKS